MEKSWRLWHWPPWMFGATPVEAEQVLQPWLRLVSVVIASVWGVRNMPRQTCLATRAVNMDLIQIMSVNCMYQLSRVEMVGCLVPRAMNRDLIWIASVN
ncbi:hypothetical protein BDQ17DRAFT_1375635 [Cyathus striatus]|nr:hypothetical protein BDQ17DRAFT_1375635 [Cyathus striatus]